MLLRYQIKFNLANKNEYRGIFTVSFVFLKILLFDPDFFTLFKTTSLKKLNIINLFAMVLKKLLLKWII